MFPFRRKHGTNQSSSKPTGKRKVVSRDNDDDDMSEEEYSEYIRNNDPSRHQLTRGAHDRYCHGIIREKEDVLLSSLSSIVDPPTPVAGIDRFGPRNNIFKNLLENSRSGNEYVNKFRESVSMPSSPVKEDVQFLSTETAVTRRKSDTFPEAGVDDARMSEVFADGGGGSGHAASVHQHEDEYILTLKIDNLAANVEDISLYRIGPKQDIEMYENEFYGVENCDDELIEESGGAPGGGGISNSTKMTNSNNSVQYKEIDNETSIALKKLLIGSSDKYFSNQWLRQCFSFCHISASRWRLVQMKSGCCGVIAAVEAYLIKSLLFEPSFCKFKEPLRPSQKEVVDGFIHALAYIIWQAGDFKRAVLIIPSSIEIDGAYRKDGITDSFFYIEYVDFEQLKESVASNIRFFINSPNHGYLNFLICVILSRGIYRIHEDMDDDSVPLITENGHCSLELVMLLVTGQAVSNVFDNDIKIDSCLLKGVKRQSDVGLLSLFEHLNTCEVGLFLKTPKYPVWLVNYTDHFTVLFSSKLEHAQQNIEQPFVLYHYDSMTAFSCENDIKLVIDPLANYSDDQLEKDQTHLQLCIRTKWKNAIVIYAENSEVYLV